MGPNPNHIYPNKNIKQIVYIKNVITRSNIVVGEYTYLVFDSSDLSIETMELFCIYVLHCF